MRHVSVVVLVLVAACQSAPPPPPPTVDLQAAAGIGIVIGTINTLMDPATRAAYIKHNRATFTHLDGTPYTVAELDAVLPTKPAAFTMQQRRAAGMP